MRVCTGMTCEPITYSSQSTHARCVLYYITRSYLLYVFFRFGLNSPHLKRRLDHFVRAHYRRRGIFPIFRQRSPHGLFRLEKLQIL